MPAVAAALPPGAGGAGWIDDVPLGDVSTLGGGGAVTGAAGRCADISRA